MFIPTLHTATAIDREAHKAASQEALWGRGGVNHSQMRYVRLNAF
jgi:hypothetical protein